MRIEDVWKGEITHEWNEQTKGGFITPEASFYGRVKSGGTWHRATWKNSLKVRMNILFSEWFLNLDPPSTIDSGWTKSFFYGIGFFFFIFQLQECICNDGWALPDCTKCIPSRWGSNCDREYSRPRASLPTVPYLPEVRYSLRNSMHYSILPWTFS